MLKSLVLELANNVFETNGILKIARMHVLWFSMKCFFEDYTCKTN